MLLVACLKKVWRVLYPIVFCTLAYTNINPETFTILGFFLLMDTVTGVTKAIAVGKKPTSRMFIIWVISKLLLLMIPLFISLLAKATVPEWNIERMIAISLWLLTTAEFYSIIQNIVSIKLGREIEEYDAITKVLTWLLRYIRALIDKNLPKQ